MSVFVGQRPIGTRNSGGLVPQNEFDVEQIDFVARGIFNDLEGAASNLFDYRNYDPRESFPVQNYVNDWKNAFRIKTKVGGINTIEQLDAQEAGDLPGAQETKVDLIKLVQSPASTIVDTLKFATKDALNPKDLEQRTKQRLFREIIFSGNAPVGSGARGFLDQITETAKKTTESALEKRYGNLDLSDFELQTKTTSRYYTSKSGTPVNIGRSVGKVKKKYRLVGGVLEESGDSTYNLIKQLDNNVYELIGKQPAATARRGAEAKLQATSLKIHRELLKQNRAKIGKHFLEAIDNPRNPLDKIAVSAITTNLAGFTEQVNLVEILEDVDSLFGKTSKDLVKSVRLGVFKEGELTASKLAGATGLADVEKVLQSASGNFSNLLGAIDAAEQKIGAIEALYNTPDIGIIHRQYFENNVVPLKEFITDFKARFSGTGEASDFNANRLARKFKDALTSGDEQTIKSLQRDLGILKDAFSGDNPTGYFASKIPGLNKAFGDGAFKQYLKSLSEDYIINTANVPGSVLDTLEKVGVPYSTRVAGVVRLFREENAGYLARDIGNQLEKGILVSNQLWKKFKLYFPNIHQFNRQVQDILKRTHNLGLVFEADYEAIAFGPFAALMETNFFQNNFRVKVDLGGGVTQSFKFQGGKDFENFAKIYTFFKENKFDPELIQKLYSAASISDLADFTDAIKDLDATGLTSLKPDDLQKLSVEIQSLIDFINKNLGNRLVSPDGKINAAILKSVFDAIESIRNNPNYIAITQKFAGVLEKFNSSLSKLQSLGLQKISKFIAPIQYVKTAISKTLATALTGLIVTATGGTTGAFSGAIEVALQYAIQKLIVDPVFKVINLFAHPAQLGAAIEEQIAKYAKRFVSWCMLPCGCVGLLACFVIIVIISTIPTLNPTKDPGGNTPQAPTANTAPQNPGGNIPGNTGPGGGGTPVPACGAIEPTIVSCPLASAAGPAFTAQSYSPTGGHGTNNYWSLVGGIPCRFEIPIIASLIMDGGSPISCTGTGHGPSAACAPSNDSASVCFLPYTYDVLDDDGNVIDTVTVPPRDDPAQTYYGYALDIEDGATDTGSIPDFNNPPVYAPTFDGVVGWTLSSGSFRSNDNGGYIVLTGDNGVTEYKMLFLHVTPNPSCTTTAQAGNAIGTLYPTEDFDDHLHIELLRRPVGGGSWEPITPETVISC